MSPNLTMCDSFYLVQNSIPFILMQFNKDQIHQLAERARMGPQKQIAVDLKRVRKEALLLQTKYEQARQKGPVSSFDFLLDWEEKKETKYLITKVRSLARIISQGQFDRTKFDFMMNMGQMVKSGRMREYDASVAVGQRFANEYVTPAMQEDADANTTTSNL